jgi:hypothetical protein
MENKEDRYKTADVAVCYFVAPRIKGEEVTFPRLRPSVDVPKKRKPDLALLKVAAISIGYFSILIPFATWTEYLRNLDFLRPPPPELVPLHPTHGMIITDHKHTWVYFGPPVGVNGWVDP